MKDSDLKITGLVMCAMIVIFAPYTPEVGFMFLMLWAGVLAFSSVV